MSADSGEPEFSEQERKALRQIASERIEDWPTRRAALGSGAALLGGAGFVTGRASADASTSDSDGDIGTPSNRVDVFSDGVDATSATIDDLNNVEWISPGDDWQTVIDSVYDNSNSEKSGTAKLLPTVTYDLSGTTLPVTVKPGVTLDIQDSTIYPTNDGSDLFRLRNDVTVLTHGSILWESNFTGRIYHLTDEDGNVGNADPAQVIGWGKVKGSSPTIFRFTGKSGGSITNTYGEVTCHNAGTVVEMACTDSSSFLNNNTIWFRGAVSAETTVDIFGGSGGGTIRNNSILTKGVQIKSTTPEFLKINRADTKFNRFGGLITDPQNFTNNVAAYNSAGEFNTVYLDPGYISSSHGGVTGPDASKIGNGLQLLGYPSPAPMDLSGATGPVEGFVWADDGTNTTSTNAELAIWDSSLNSGSGGWYTMGGDVI